MSESYDGGHAPDAQDDIALEHRRLELQRLRALEMKFLDGKPAPAKVTRNRKRVAGSRRSRQAYWTYRLPDARGTLRGVRQENGLERVGNLRRRFGTLDCTPSYWIVQPARKMPAKVRPHVGMLAMQLGDAIGRPDSMVSTFGPLTGLAAYLLLGDSPQAIPCNQGTVTRTWDITPTSELPTPEALAAYGPQLPVGDYTYGDATRLRRGVWDENGDLVNGKPIKRSKGRTTPLEGKNTEAENYANTLLARAGMDPYEGIPSKLR